MRRVLRVVDRIEADAERNFLQAAAEVRAFVLDQVSGNIPTSYFRSAGHPLSDQRGRDVYYRDKHGKRKRGRVSKGFVPLLPVNEQTGELKSRFQEVVLKQYDRMEVTWSFPGTVHALTLKRGGNPGGHQIDRGFEQSIARKVKSVYARYL